MCSHFVDYSWQVHIRSLVLNPCVLSNKLFSTWAYINTSLWIVLLVDLRIIWRATSLEIENSWWSFICNRAGFSWGVCVCVCVCVCVHACVCYWVFNSELLSWLYASKLLGFFFFWDGLAMLDSSALPASALSSWNYKGSALGFELRASHLLDNYSTTQTTSPAHSVHFF
jgi:hypothetical protein